MPDTVERASGRETAEDPWQPGGTDARLPGATGPQPALAGLGRYVVLRPIGRGGMGVVLAAYDPSLDRKVAIKVLRDGIESGSEAAVRMQREAQAMARLSHPNVAQVYEVGEAEGRLYLVMEYVEGATLGAWLVERPRTRAEVLRCFMEAGRGLAAAHAAGLIHRDFKPENAMIGADGRVRVLDFGLSRSVLAPVDVLASHPSGSNPEMTITAAGTLIGTPAYMSPEQHMRREADARSDQFSFCVALYEALYGQRPFVGRNVRELGVRVAAGAILEPPPHTRVPAWLREVLVRGLQPDPAARWPSMDALLAALERDPQRTRRRWLLAGLGVAAVAGASYGAAAYQVAQSQLCSGAADELHDVWDPVRREALAQAVRATGVSYADSLLTSVTTRLDAYAERWVAGHTDACEAHRRGHASAQLFDRKIACLRQRRTELAATVDVLTQTTAASVANLVEATVLPPIASCEDDTRLLADVPLPADPKVAAEVERARGRLARLQALERAGRHPEALTGLEPELAAMQQLGDVALLAEAHLLAGKLRMHQMQGGAGRVHLGQALELALEARLDAVAAEALVIEIYQIGYVQRRMSEALNLVPLAWGLVRRVGSPPQLAALLHNDIGAVHGELADLDQSIRSYERGLDLLDPRDEDPLRWVLVYNLTNALVAVGEHERARTLGAPALLRLEQIYDRCHLVTASLRSVLADVDLAEGRFDAAIASLEECDRCLRDAFPIHALSALEELVHVAYLRGDDVAAWQYMARADAAGAAAPEFRPHFLALNLLRADLELRAGRHDEARRILEAERTEQARGAEANHPPLVAIDIHLARLDHRAGDHEAALAHLHGSVPLPRHWMEERGLQAFTHAQVLHALGREPAQVGVLIEQALAEYRRAGAAAHARDIAEIEAWAAALPPAP